MILNKNGKYVKKFKERKDFMFGVFNVIPSGFFNNLASGSNQRIYADCIQLIYKEYEGMGHYDVWVPTLLDGLSEFLK